MDSGGTSPAVGKVYLRLFSIVQHIDQIEGLSEEDRAAVKLVVNNRWQTMHTDMHSVGFVLDPQYNFEAYSQATNEEVMSGFCNI